MKKFSKIISAIIIATLLITAICTTAMAAITSDKSGQLRPSGTGIVASTISSVSDFENVTNKLWNYTSTSNFAMQYGEVRGRGLSKYGVRYAYENHYANVSFGPTYKSSHYDSKSNPYWEINLNGESKYAMNYDYVVIDFDFNADSYVTDISLFYGDDYEKLQADSWGYAIYKDGTVIDGEDVSGQFYDGNTQNDTLDKVFYKTNNILNPAVYNSTSNAGKGYAAFTAAITIDGVSYANNAYYVEGSDGTPMAEGGSNVTYDTIAARFPTVMIPGIDVEYGTGENEGFLVYKAGNSENATPGTRYTIKDHNGNPIDVPTNKIDLSYTDNQAINFMFTKNLSSGSYPSSASLYIVKRNGVWYIAPDKGDTPGSTWRTLSTVAGEWNHLTVVTKFDNSVNYTKIVNGESVVDSNQPFNADIVNGIDALASGETYTHTDGTVYSKYTVNLSKSRGYAYLNGEHFYTDTSVYTTDNPNSWASGVTWQSLYGYRVRFEAQRNQVFEKKFSLGYDNIAVNHYVDGYKGDLANFMSAPTNSIYNCDDVVYNGNYDAPNGAPIRAAVYNGETTDDAITLTPYSTYDVAIGAVKNATEGQYVILEHGLKNIRPKNNFYVSYPDGETFTVAADSGYLVSETPINVTYDGKEYTFYSVFKPYQINWYSDMSMQDTLTESALIVPGGDIVYPTAPDAEVINHNTYKYFVGWKYVSEYVDENPVWSDLTATTFDQTLSTVADACGGALYAAPVYAEKTISYAITNTSGVISEYVFKGENDDLVRDIQADKSIKLFEDINDLDTTSASKSSGETYIAISLESNSTLLLDLNGHTLNLNNLTYDYAITINNKNTLIIKSSEIGGKIICKTGLVRGNKNGYSNLTLGTKGDVCGENAKLTLHIQSLFGTQGCEGNNYYNQVKLYGVNYMTYNVGSAVINLVNIMTHVEIDNCYFLLNKSDCSLLEVNSSGGAKATGSINATVKNSTIISTTNDGGMDHIIATLGNYTNGTADNPKTPIYQATFDNCLLYGYVVPTDTNTVKYDPEAGVDNRGKVYLTNGTKLCTTETLPEDIVMTKTAGHKLAKVSKDISITGYTINGPVTHNFTANYQESVNVKVNLTTNNGFIANFAVHKDLATAAYAKAGEEALVGIENGDFIVYSLPIATASDGVATIYLDTGADELYAAKVSLADYFAALLKLYDDADTQALAVNAANYCNALYKYANSGADFEGYKTIIDQKSDKIIEANAEPVKVNAQEQNVFGDVQFIISEGNVPMFAFTKIGDGVVSVKFENIYGEEAEIVCAPVTVNKTEYYAVKNMPVYEMVGAFVVCVDGAEIGNYSIANYSETTTDAGAKAIADALYGYGVAVKNWKIED